MQRQRSARAVTLRAPSFVALMLGHAAQGLTFTAFTPALAAIAQDFNGSGHGAIIAQLCVTIASAGVVIGALVSGWIIARMGFRRTVLLSAVLYGVAGSGGLYLSDAASLLASRILVGFAAACMVTACIATIATLYEPHARARVIGVSTGVGSATSLAGLVVGGATAQAFGWRFAFLQYPLLAIPAVLLVLFAFPGGEAAAPEQGETERSAGAAAWSLWPLYLLATVMTAVMFMGSTQFAFLLPLVGFKTSGSIGLVMSAITLLGVIVSLLFGPLERRLGLQGALVAGLAASALGMSLIGLVQTPAIAVCGAALMGVYVGVTVPYVHHVVTLRAAPSARARAVGLANAFAFAGALINPFVFAPVIAAVGVQGAFVVVGVAMAVLAAAALALRLRIRAFAPAG